VPVIAVAIAALPAIALLLVVVTRMEALFFGDAYEERRRAVIGNDYPPVTDGYGGEGYQRAPVTPGRR
jgi:hypothetical protein